MKKNNMITITRKILDTKSKAMQQIKIEDITLSNTTGLESNTLKHYFFDKTAIIQIQYWLLPSIGQKTILIYSLIVGGLPAV